MFIAQSGPINMSLVARSTIEFTIFACKFDRQLIEIRLRSRFPANHRFVSSSTTLSPFPALSRTVDQIRVTEPQISPLPLSSFLFLSPKSQSLSDRWFLFLFKPIFLFFILLKLKFFLLFTKITVVSPVLGGFSLLLHWFLCKLGIK